MIRLAITFQPVFSMWLILSGAVLLLLFLFWKEINRKIRFLQFRIIAIVLMVGAITSWLLQPMASSLKDSTAIILLTKNYEQAVADSLIKKYPNYLLLREHDAASYKDATALMPYALADHKNDLAFVLGDGLPYYAQEKVTSSYSFLPGKLPKGITQLNAPKSVPVNQTAVVTGALNILGKTSVILEEPGGHKDSLVLTGQGVKPFSLSFQTKQVGLFRYAVVLRDSLTSKVEGYLPIEVTAQKRLNLLFVQKYPSAEVRYLKSFLGERGHELVVRSQVSKNNFHYEFANRESARVDKLTSSALADFDLLLMDTESLYGLSASELKGVEEAVKGGLGVIILMNDVDLKKDIPLLKVPFKVYAHDTVRLKIGKQNFVLPAIPIATPASLSITPVTTSATRVLSGYRHEVAGKIGFQLLHETYRLLLEGKAADYAALWSPLLESTARLKEEPFKIQIVNSFPLYQDEPFSIQIISSGDEPKLKANNVLLPLQEDILIDGFWHADTWTGNAGWHSLTAQDSTVLHYYVASDSEWNTLRIANQQRQHVINHTSFISKQETNVITEQKPISSLWLMMIFLLASGFLWLAPKL